MSFHQPEVAKKYCDVLCMYEYDVNMYDMI